MSDLTPRERALRHLLSDLEPFSRHLVGVPLRPYQLEPARAILASVLQGRGLTFTVMMSRQAGKNELSAQLQGYLLTRFSRRGGSIVKAAPTFRPQIVNSMLRLQRVLDNDLTRDRWTSQFGYVMSLGQAKIFFFSGDEGAQVVGATASLLLEIDEAQDFDEQKYLKDFRPMGATSNTTTVLYGTAWTADTLLERVRQENLRLEGQDGVRRHFAYPWQVVGSYNPAYRAYVEAEIARLGPTHPLVRTQYLLESLDSSGRLFSETQLAQMVGQHPSLVSPLPGEVYVAGLDVAGEDEEAEDAALRALKPRKDSTALTIARLVWGADLGVLEPTLEVVAHYWWTGRRHRDLFATLVDLLRNVWRVPAVVVDATGVGAGVASFLVGALGPDVAIPFTFSAVSKSDLGYQLLAAVNAGRFKLYAADALPSAGAGPDGYAYTEHELALETFWAEARVAKSTLGVNQRLQWYVDPRDGHDDLLVSAALTVAAAGHAIPRVASGRSVRRE